MKQFDLSLGKWGPYNKEYLGVCHVADAELGASFNVELFPGLFRRRVFVSHANTDNGLKMWGANPDLTRFTYRYELEWKDRVYCDADFVITDDSRVDISCTFVNNTDAPQSVNMNLCASIQYPTVKVGRDVASYRIPYTAELPDGCVMIDALDYSDIYCAERLAQDGRYLGELQTDGATGKSSILYGRFFSHPNHYVRYIAPFDSDSLLVRYMAGEDTAISISVDGEPQTLSLCGGGFSTATVKARIRKGAVIEIRPTGKPLSLDCLVFGDNAEQTLFKASDSSLEPERTLDGNKMTLKYEGIPTTYTVEWQEPTQMVRRYYYSDIGKALQLCTHDHVSTVLRARDGLGVYENVLSDPIFLAPGESRTLHYTVTSGDAGAAVPRELYRVASNPDGEPFAFSQNMMAATTFLNVVYPIYTRRQYIRHNTPGRNWDCLYSWDSGFIGMGLATADFDRAFECLYTYLTPVGDRHSPFVFHGSVVPTQIFLYQYLFNKYPEHRERLAEIYPMVKQFFDFYAKMDERADQTGSGLLKTWGIFYNSGGWDDYPPQEYLHRATREGLDTTTANTTPIITTAITVLIAKIMRGIAAELGLSDLAEYDAVVAKYSAPILEHAWNEDTGYFSYVVHGKDGRPERFLKHPDGSDYNQGFDGIYPYIAGITDSHQDERILANVMDGLMTPIGVGVVDTRASYYNPGGYWNGSVWMPHQWILWRSLFDRGECELAFRIADTALKVWKRETDESYSCFENFMSANGRGSGYHHFSGLSTPVLMFFESYYKPGTVTVGFGTTVKAEIWNSEKTALTLECRSIGKAPAALVCLAAGAEYSFSVNGVPAMARQVTEGAYEIGLPTGSSTLKITAKM